MDRLEDRVEHLLDTWKTPPMRRDLRRRLLSIPAASRKPVLSPWRYLRAWVAAGGLAAAAALGGIVGVSPLGEMMEIAVTVDTTPEDEWVAMVDAVVEDVLQ